MNSSGAGITVNGLLISRARSCMLKSLLCQGKYVLSKKVLLVGEQSVLQETRFSKVFRI